MKDLIEALQIFLKYANDDSCPTHCEHDTLSIGCGIEENDVTQDDKDKLEKLGFFLV